MSASQAWRAPESARFFDVKITWAFELTRPDLHRVRLSGAPQVDPPLPSHGVPDGAPPDRSRGNV